MQPTNKLDLVYKLEGEFTEGIDVFEISPILLHLGQLIQEANNVLYPDGRKVTVNVKPFEEGSFIVDILIFSANNLQHVIDMVNQENIQQAKEVLEWIGLIRDYAAGGTLTLLGLIKLLQGKPKAVEKVKPGEYIYTSNTGNKVTVNDKVHNLFQNTTIQTAVFNTYGRPFENPKVTGIKTFEHEENKKMEEEQEDAVVISKEDAGYFMEFKKPEVIDESEVVNTSTLRIFFNPKRGSYEGNKGPYSFTISGNKNNIYYPVTISDEEFLQKMEKGEVRLHNTDLIEAELEVKQKVKDNEVVDTSYTITKVLNYKKAKEHKQLAIDDSSQEKE